MSQLQMLYGQALNSPKRCLEVFSVASWLQLSSVVSLIATKALLVCICVSEHPDKQREYRSSEYTG